MAAHPRLFVSAERLCPPAPLRLCGAEHHYLSRVLRLGIGAEVVLLDGKGRVATARLARISGEELELEYLSVEAVAPPGAEPGGVTLYMGLLKGERHDFVVQKATELGCRRIVTVLCQRSVPEFGHDPGRAARRQQRWQRIAQAAAQQCRRLDLPEVAGPLPLGAVLEAQAEAELRLLLYEGPAPPLRSVLYSGPGGAAARSIELLLGPEGGFADTEVAAATAAGFIPVSLGPRILRAETAALAALAVVLSG